MSNGDVSLPRVCTRPWTVLSTGPKQCEAAEKAAAILVRLDDVNGSD